MSAISTPQLLNEEGGEEIMVPDPFVEISQAQLENSFMKLYDPYRGDLPDTLGVVEQYATHYQNEISTLRSMQARIILDNLQFDEKRLSFLKAIPGILEGVEPVIPPAQTLAQAEERLRENMHIQSVVQGIFNKAGPFLAHRKAITTESRDVVSRMKAQDDELKKALIACMPDFTTNSALEELFMKVRAIIKN